MNAQQHKVESENSVQNLVCKSCYGTYIIPWLQKKRLLGKICDCHTLKVQNINVGDNEYTPKDRQARSKRPLANSLVFSTKNPYSVSELKILENIRTALRNGKGLEELYPNISQLKEVKKSLQKLEDYEKYCQDFEMQKHKQNLILDNEIETEEIQKKLAKEKYCKLELENQMAVLKLKIEKIESARLDCFELPPGLEALPKSMQLWLKSFKNSQENCLFLYGPPGTGKTTLASFALFYAIIYNDDIESLYLGSDEIISARKDTLTAPFKATDSNQVRFLWKDIYNIIMTKPILVIDDLGSQKATESTVCAYTEVVSARYKSGLPTIYTSNHWADGGLGNKNLADMIGERAADRVLGSVQCRMDGPSKRQAIQVKKEFLVEEYIECEKVDLEIKNKFEITPVNTGQSTCMTWLAQNPIFQVVSDHERAKLVDSLGRDLDLPARDYKDTWKSGDTLTVWGPQLGMEDQLTYFALLEILSDLHRNGSHGSSFTTTFSEISEKLGIRKDGFSKHQMILKRLERLRRVSIKFQNAEKKTFFGGFIDSVVYDGKNKHHRIGITLNATMIKFYEIGDFSCISIQELKKMGDWERVLHLFLESQPECSIKLPLNKFALLAGKENYDKKQLAKNARAAVNHQIKMGYQTQESKVSAGNIHCIRTNRTID